MHHIRQQQHVGRWRTRGDVLGKCPVRAALDAGCMRSINPRAHPRSDIDRRHPHVATQREQPVKRFAVPSPDVEHARALRDLCRDRCDLAVEVDKYGAIGVACDAEGAVAQYATYESARRHGGI